MTRRAMMPRAAAPRSRTRLRASAARDRRGFALLAMLWVIVMLATLALTATLAARESTATAQNRLTLARARWNAEGCVARSRAAIDAALVASVVSGTAPDRDVWEVLDSVVAASPLVATMSCDVSLTPVGAALDINAADTEQLRALLLAIGVTVTHADSLQGALADWIDADDLARPHGAERAWYEEQGRHPPRNGPLADVRELARVRGFERLASAVEPVLSVELGRIALNHAPPAVLAAVPGFTAEAVARLAELRRYGGRLTDLGAFGAGLSVEARDALAARYPEAVRATAIAPDAWILTARGRADPGGPSAEVELRLVRTGQRAAVVRRRVRT